MPRLPPDPRLPLPPDCDMSPPPVPPWSRHPAVGTGLPPPRLPLRQHPPPRSDFPQRPNPRRPKALRPAAPPRSDFPRPADQEGRRSLLDGRCPHPARRHRPPSGTDKVRCRRHHCRELCTGSHCPAAGWPRPSWEQCIS
ncbi:hypothetical protein PVAP13_4KG397301 [Panicum virgatum]|uniref:Uncharacterized protein n=1 Tax=Panicum virgatum TaxID=38727 RepID=A0A8T0TSD6_PANVG|nr:hypothetical protein PVAP13_4KG397301 [Panicum virgatum]KAG2610780.1 hypothetical protein PVAP13_4KG397301 [Panicum virgatum]